MSDTGRRTFLKTSAIALGGVAVGGCAEPRPDLAPAALDSRLLRAVGRLVLPSELGDATLARSITDFEDWLHEFEPVAELPHGYGSQEIRYGPPDPAPRWRAQLEALELEARKRFGSDYADLDSVRGRELLERQLGASSQAPEALTSQPARADHVAVGLLAWFYASSEATDLCYGRRIGARTCRPLSQLPPTSPLPSGRGRKRPGEGLMTRVIETDVCIIGSGVTAAMVAEKLADERDASITVLEAGDRPIPLRERGRWWRRYVEYGESPWPDDHLDGQDVIGRPHGYSPSFLVGGLAMHWGAVTPRFSPEDFRVRSLYGVGDDWPLTYEDLDPAYQEAEERMGVAGEPGPADLDPRSAPYPMPPLPLTYNLIRLKEWGESTGIPFWAMPSAKNSTPYRGRAACCRNDTCWPICPVGARYSPDFTFDGLEESGRVQLQARTLVRRLVLADGSDRVERAEAVDRDDPEEPIHVYARSFVVAAGYVWSPHLILLSADSRFPDGLANRSGLVGKYLAGHRAVNAFARVPFQLYAGMANQHSLVSQRFMRRIETRRYLRHDFRIWESAAGRGPGLRDEEGRLLLGDDLLDDWRSRALGGGTARLRAYYDVLPARESELTLDPSARNPWGDPLPRVSFRDHEDSAASRGFIEETIAELFGSVARSGGGEVLSVRPGDSQEHPGGGCRMGTDPARSVVDRFGRSHDHENLFVVGAPTFVTAGCTNGTLTMAALGIHAATELGREFPERTA